MRPKALRTPADASCGNVLRAFELRFVRGSHPSVHACRRYPVPTTQ